jgi:beta-lactamase superfamily II metal-dependent hydrolase
MAKPHVRVRMYRVGFGDCFLVSLTDRVGDRRHLLFDCGVHPAGDAGTLEAVVANIAEETDERLDLIVASHAHEDHIAGFGRHADVFSSFEIGEVWLPWSENKNDEDAIRLGRQRAALFAMLSDHFQAVSPSAAAAAALGNAAVGRNQRSLDNLRSAFGTSGRIVFVEAGHAVTQAFGTPGLSLRVLGPPRDEDFLKKMHPPKAERFFRLGAGGEVNTVNAFRPFPPAEEVPKRALAVRLSEADEKRMQQGAAGSHEALAFVLDQALNNSSVVVLVSYLGRNLLFPGDAQYGGWKHWMEAPDGEEILGSLDFYKVSHHGSHNATPKTAVELMTGGDLAAMVSTQSKPWESIPYPKLITALEACTAARLVRSDSLPIQGAPVGPVLSTPPTGVQAGDLWYDLTIPV